MQNCMTKNNVGAAEKCTTPGEIGSCKCGMYCHHIEWMGQNVCSMCQDFGIQADCETAPEDLDCKWVGDNDDTGICLGAKNECNVLGKKECAAAQPKCKYMKKEKKCMKNYEPVCMGLKEDLHHQCYDIKTK